MKKHQIQKKLYVYADWIELNGPRLMGILQLTLTRGKEIFFFEYDEEWLRSAPAQVLDPDLRLYAGPQYLSEGQINFGIFLDSSPDRWGRLLMKKREATFARIEKRPVRTLMESDYLLGVFDGHRMGALRFKTDPDGDYLDNNSVNASPPWTKLRDLEFASKHIEDNDNFEDPNYLEWIRLLLGPGSSLGGARPKASVIDPAGELWIAKFPSNRDHNDVGAWEMVVHELAINSGLNVPIAKIEKFSSTYHTFLTKRFDRSKASGRIHFASALTMLGYPDGIDYSEGASYLEIVEFLIQHGARVDADLKELWKRIVFYICISNTDDHLRNHGFLLTEEGWILSPAFDINPTERATGLSLNITENDNSLDLSLAMDVAEYFRIEPKESDKIIAHITSVIREWSSVADKFGISKSEQEVMSDAFRNAEA